MEIPKQQHAESVQQIVSYRMSKKKALFRAFFINPNPPKGRVLKIHYTNDIFRFFVLTSVIPITHYALRMNYSHYELIRSIVTCIIGTIRFYNHQDVVIPIGFRLDFFIVFCGRTINMILT